MNRSMVIGLVLWAATSGMASAGDNARASIGDNRLSAGDSVTLDEFVPGNAFLAGGRVRLDNRVGGGAIVTGGDVTIAGSIGRKLFATGGDLAIEGTVEGDVVAAGGKVRVARSARLRSDVALAGGSVEMDGEVGGDLRAFGESITVNGVVLGDLDVAGERIRVGPEAHIAGKLTYRSGGAIVIDPQARIEQGIEQRDHDERGWLRKLGRGATWVGGVMFTFGVVLLGVLLLLGMPGFSRDAASLVRREPLRSAGLGCVMLVGVPIAMILLTITIVGIPLALMLAFGYVALLMLGYLVAALFVGDLVLQNFGTEKFNALGWRVLFLLLALFVLSVLGRVPLLGGLAIFLLFLAGIGAFTKRSWQGIRQKDTAAAA